jgi:Raf kinase inhibitor-like YbhB/YbcL family protein
VVPDAGGDPRLAHMGTARVNYAGCLLDFTLRFFKDQLDQIQIKTQGENDCRETIERNLTLRYHDPNIPAACPNIVSRQWRLPGTTASYYYDCATPLRGMYIAFSETTDLSGRVVEENRNNNCQPILADVLPPADGAGASNPVLSPDLPNLGCGDNYPPISFRLQEQGFVTLDVRVSADGTVDDAQLATSSSKTRLDNGAIALAQHKLKFIPAMREGIPVEAARQIRITFRILHFIHGPADVIYNCQDGSNSFAVPCYGPFPGLTAVPPKRGAKLIVRSTDFKQGIPLPNAFTLAGANKSPALNWSRGTAGTQSYVLIAEDPVTTGSSSRDPAVFWMVLNIPATSTSLPQGVPNDLKIMNPQGAMNARGTYGGSGYQGYASRPVHFQIFALDIKLALDPMKVDRQALISAMKDHVLASGEIAANEPAN